MVLLTCHQAQTVSRIPNIQSKKDAIAKLVVGLPDFEADNDMFNDSLVDFYFHLFDFCVSRGMPWKEVVGAIDFAKIFLDGIAYVSMANAVTQMTSGLVEFVKNDRFGYESSKKLAGFFISTVISHYKLYQYLFTKDQDMISNSCEMLVEVPQSNCLSNLQFAETVGAWKYKQKLNDLNQRKDLRDREVSTQKENFIEKCCEVNMSIDIALKEHEHTSCNLDFDEAKGLVMSMTSDKLGLVDDNISLVLTKMKDTLNFEIEEKALASSQFSSDSLKKQSSRSSSASKSSGKGKRSRKK